MKHRTGPCSSACWSPVRHNYQYGELHTVREPSQLKMWQNPPLDPQAAVSCSIVLYLTATIATSWRRRVSIGTAVITPFYTYRETCLPVDAPYIQTEVE